MATDHVGKGSILPDVNDDVDESEDLVVAGRAKLTHIICGNTGAAAAFVKLYDAAAITDVTVGTTVPKMTIPVGATVDGLIASFEHPPEFANGIVIAATTGQPNNDTGAPAANQVSASVGYIKG